MNKLTFTKSRIIFLLGLALIIGAVLYAFKSSDKMQALVLVIIGLAITSGALIYVLAKSIKQMPKSNSSNESVTSTGSDIIAGLIETLAYMFFV